MEANLNAKIYGKTDPGNKLFVVTFIEEDYPEDSITEIWGAKDDNDLYDLIEESRCNDEHWGLSILRYEEIGSFPPAQRMCKCPKGNLCDQCDIHRECNHFEK